MGGTVAISAATKHPSLFAGMCLSSAACEPPPNLGLKSVILKAMSSAISAIAPTMQVMALPGNTRDPVQQANFENDKLNISTVDLRARVGREFLLAYARIAETRGEIRVPFIAAAGEFDTLVNPKAAERFVDGVGSEDKTLFVAKGRWHNLFQEKNMEEMYTLYGDWIAERCK